MTGLLRYGAYIIITVFIFSLGIWSGVLLILIDMILSIKNDFIMYLPMEARVVVFGFIIGLMFLIGTIITQ